MADASRDAPASPTRRAERRVETIAEIKEQARRQLSTEGTGGLSLRGIARAMRMSPAALFRYFDSQSALITALCVDSYDSLTEAMAAAQERAGSHPALRWQAGCEGARSWALAHPAEFALINGTPFPGYQARSAETGPAAGRLMTVVATPYLNAVAAGAADPDATLVPPLSPGPQLGGDTGTGTPVPGILINAWASILGFIAGETFGSLALLISDPDALFASHVRTVMRGMGFREDSPTP
ncbi:TetR/AcrR family transcriptional regulator [Nocardia seriolae]|uniref:HTH-type transcriptional regulator n=1 Tax=Nocardia seriolae TaxID=37332 RepID=A0A0B8NBU4_9NOCA|nr:TetR/AcrR family transcriptional regulator [Nocardia seriolae]APA97107.1 putative HTH-type transcriptional regulator [Nocardia seriolae]MTJ65104.1 TetR family transcriptional regulator [Nocardia seriolae]MTJ74881.1 TetR family transcriptional regulator [Nocardia seriolae]MTJ86971.1 TetR family transcriptional regulator [Nocardia seriolae]MTK30967.1 TetR family transcriptional regulator [Nocardia seriolae]